MDTALFSERFVFLTGFAPYRWQVRLFRRLCGDADEPGAPGQARPPSAVDLPTGLGKTSVIPIWLLARAAGAPLPRRLIYVVDRRAVVDQATEVADRIARAVGSSDPVARDIRTALELEGALPVSTLRGQHQDNRLWTEAPHAPAIVVGTVDMVGSRLGFEGYGVSRRMRPVHAGLLGVDSLIVLDEAHLVPPFEAFARGVAELARGDGQAAPDKALVAPLQVMSLSATGRDPGGEPFTLTADDRADEAVEKRLTAVKRLRLMPEIGPGELIDTLTRTALAKGVDGRRVLVFCNSRAVAQKVREALDKEIGRDRDRFGKGAALTELLVGERRFLERLQLTGDKALGIPPSPVFARFSPGAAAGEQPAFLVATSAGEVGVDLDADDIVCDLVAWERMVQRLGRVNRRSDPGESSVTVFPVASGKDKEAEDEIVDPRLRELCAPFDPQHWPTAGEDGAFDASPITLRQLKDGPLAPALLAATTSPPLRPPLTRAMVEAWSLTSLEVHPGRPKIGPWLRGWDKVEPQTAVVWRRWFPLGEEAPRVSDELKAFFRAAPPHVTETLEAPSWRVADWLQARAKALGKPKKTKDFEQAEGRPDEEDAPDDASAAGNDDAPKPDSGPPHDPIAVVLGSDREIVAVHTARRLEEMNKEALARELSFGTLVVDARFGGLDQGLLNDRRDASPLPPTLDGEGWGEASVRAAGLRITFGSKPEGERVPGEGAWLVSGFRWSLSEADGAPGLWVEQWRGKGGRHPGDPALTAEPQLLYGDDGHLARTGCEAEAIARGLTLDPHWAQLLILAAQAHDLGKDRKVWQNAMGAAPTGRPWAKTQGGGNAAALGGYRHEFGSVLDLLAEAPRHAEARTVHAAIKALSDDDRDLVLHVVAAHHGHARPTIKAWDPGEACGDGQGGATSAGEPPSRSERHAREIALRFARLQRTWGPWGLAWWEALLRAADWAASRKLNEEAPPHG